MTNISKAVIAAAGRGTRFLPVVKSYPKELVPILDKPNIQYLVEEAIGAGITDIAIIHRLGESSIEKYFSPDQDLEDYLISRNKTEYLDSLKNIWQKAKLTFIPQSADLPYGNGSPILAAKDFIGSDNFVYMFGDDLIVEETYGQYLTKMITSLEEYNSDAVVSTQEMPTEEMKRYGAVVPHTNPTVPHQISALLEKTDPPPSNFAVVGRYVISNKILDVIKTQGTTKDNELWLADALNTMAQNGVVVDEPITNGVWMTTGDPLRWLEANIAVAIKDPRLKDDLKEFLTNLDVNK
ncbi:MAG: sugar phosphate nucleotidyltransferase [Candidatus Shapirobacteria bacterium]|nr:sugar phosphate nucleotidyltransferase [Candidatus Shapirobacteria bacterium]MDD3002586.1 sugar phosphate nucleotidyltransferase [Candidatus Shapirobacteria bacterium]MDD4382783.1 sugar phosphate nucleotidyltransferase [Candidatus Shapirobacteria bacterium]